MNEDESHRDGDEEADGVRVGIGQRSWGWDTMRVILIQCYSLVKSNSGCP